MRAVALLSFWKTRNALRTLFTDPRKLIPFLFFAVCIGCSFGSSLLGLRRPPHGPGLGAVHPDPALLQGCIFLAVVLMCLGAVDSALGDTLLAFGMPDVDYLFPSPVSRKVVLAYRLPALTFGAFFTMFFFVYLYTVLLNVIDVRLPDQGTQDPPWYLGFACMFLCFGAFLNLAMFAVVRLKDRKVLHRIVLSAFLGGIAAIGGAIYLFGVQVLVPISEFPLLRWAFFPCRWAAQGLAEQAVHRADMAPLQLLLLTYGLSLVPMFVVNSNFYEQSIVSSERVAAIRRAAKGGIAAQQANRAERFKYKGTRSYSVSPFGHGAMAIVWAHLCAAVKRPYANFVLPVMGGTACGVFGCLMNTGFHEAGIGLIFFFAFYSSIGFMTSARSASEAAVRRRDLFDPLPVPAWQSVAANLVVPWTAMFLFCLCAGIAYAALGSDQWPLVVFGLCVFFPLRLSARMVLQYVMVLAYPDFSDKVQQLLAQGVYYLMAAPFLILELVFAVPALLLHSLWLGLVTLSVLEVVFLAALVWVSGIAASRAVATGEPVNLWQVFSRSTA